MPFRPSVRLPRGRSEACPLTRICALLPQRVGRGAEGKAFMLTGGRTRCPVLRGPPPPTLLRFCPTGAGPASPQASRGHEQMREGRGQAATGEDFKRGLGCWSTWASPRPRPAHVAGPELVCQVLSPSVSSLSCRKQMTAARPGGSGHRLTARKGIKNKAQFQVFLNYYRKKNSRHCPVQVMPTARLVGRAF